MGRPIRKSWHDDVCKASRVLLETCPTSFKLPSLYRYTLSSPTLFNPPSRTTSIYRCPEPTLPTVGDSPKLTTGLFFSLASGDVRYLHIGSDPSPAFNNTSQLLFNTNLGNTEQVYHMESDSNTKILFTLERWSPGNQKLVKRPYSISNGVVTMGTPTTLMTENFTSDPNFAERLQLARDLQRIFIGTSGSAANPYIIKEYDYDYNLLTTYIPAVPRDFRTQLMWVDNGRTNILWRHSGTGADTLRYINPSTLVETDTLLDPPTLVVTSSHPCACSKFIGKAYELAPSGIWETQFPAPVNYNLLYAPPGSSYGMSLMENRERIAYSTSNGDIDWMNLQGGDRSTIWSRSSESLAKVTIDAISGGTN